MAGRIALGRGDAGKAVMAGRYDLSLPPTDSQTHFNMGMALMKLGQRPEAISRLRAAARANPANADLQTACKTPSKVTDRG
jgi:predicted Zn-dependent protease